MKYRLITISVLVALFFSFTSIAYTKGIYLTAHTASVTKKMKYYIREAKALGIDTFVIDVWKPNKRYAKNIRLVKQAGIRYVARVVVFPHGGTRAQVASKKYWHKRWKQANYAIQLGADSIQLDYIRYKKTNRASKQNAKNVLKVIQFFRQKMEGTGVKLQIDIFGVAAHGPSLSIGQNVVLFAPELNAINPMVYPSHYEPYRHHAVTPYQTVYKSVKLLNYQLRNFPKVKVYAYIEVYNYRYPMGRAKKARYIRAQIEGALAAGAHGYYVWSPQNKYKLFFSVLRSMQSRR